MRTEEDRVVALRRVGLTFGGSRVFEGLDIDVGPGELLAVVGEAGCGKTAFLKLIAGLVKPTAGEVRVLGQDVGSLRGEALLRHTHCIGLVVREPRLLPYLTVAEQVGRPLRADPRLGLREVRRRVGALLELVGLLGTEGRYPPELAPALHRRVALAQAVAPRPPILLCDSPMAGLDPWQAEALRAALRRLHCTLGLTTLVTTQDLLSAYDLGDRVAVLQGGKVVFNRRGNAPACGATVGMPGEADPITPAAA